MSPVLSKQKGSSPSWRQALMAHSPLLPPPMMATFFAMLRSTIALLPGDSVGQGTELPGVRVCKTLILAKEVPSKRGSPSKVCLGLQSHCSPHQVLRWPVLGFALT